MAEAGAARRPWRDLPVRGYLLALAEVGTAFGDRGISFWP